MKPVQRILAIVAACGLAAGAFAGEIGDKAPGLVIKKWVKGNPVDVTKADGKHVYVVEFWATWCPPCRASIPHMTEMQKKYKDKNVTFIGVSTEDVNVVRKFVEKMGDKMEYTVAVDDGRKTSKAYMKAFGVNGIPHAFIIDQTGHIIWHDHPMAGIDKIIDQVIAGKFGVPAAKKMMAERKAKALQAKKTFSLFNKYFALASKSGQQAEAAVVGAEIIKLGGDNPGLMNRFAWDILTRDGIANRDYALALKAAEAANKATKGENPSILDTYALALFKNGKKAKALKVEEKAVELAKKDGRDPQMTADLEKRLKMFRENP